MKWRTFVSDFETTVYKGQTDTRVWAAALVEIYSEDVSIYHSIGELYEALSSLDSNLRVYYHNLKFDGSFWLYYLLTEQQFTQALEYTAGNKPLDWLSNKDMPPHSLKYGISQQNRWYTLTFKTDDGKIVELRDSAKLLPFSVERIGKSFDTKHKKLSMTYEGYRYPGCEITPQEQEYIKNDVLVVKEAIEIMFSEGHDKLTIGSCCLAEYKSIISKDRYNHLYPNMYDIALNQDEYGEDNAGDWVRRSYKGGWCYLVPGKATKLFTRGVTADVNSLYPSVMSGESGDIFPTGTPHFWKGDYFPDETNSYIKEEANGIKRGIYWFVRVRTRFYLKPGKLPTIQIKGDKRYNSTAWLETSDVWDARAKRYVRSYKEADGTVTEAIPTLTLTMTDWKLICEHYNLEDTTILDGCWFDAESGLFDEYIEKYRKIKMESKGAIRELAKLFLNNLYGKMGANTDSSFRVARVEDGRLVFDVVEQHNKVPGYIPVGTAITSYARNFTIRAAQANYHGPENPGFIYADTDSIHCDLSPEEVTAIKVDPVKFLHWKLEATWDKGWFVRQKTYIEHVIESDLKPVNPYYNVKCAGMSEHCKNLFINSINPSFNFTALEKEEQEGYSEKERAFLSVKRTLSDFNVGLTVPGQLKQRMIEGGALLCEQDYKMTPRKEH